MPQSSSRKFDNLFRVLPKTIGTASAYLIGVCGIALSVCCCDLQETIDCWFKTDAKSVWQKSALPEWLSSALGALDVPWAPSAWQEAPALPAHLKYVLQQRCKCCVIF